MGRQEELIMLLSYMRYIIQWLKRTNTTRQSDIKYTLPSEEFWNNCCGLFDSIEFIELYNKVSSFIKKDRIIENIAFYSYDNKVFPLWNPAIMEVFYHSLKPDETKYPRQAFLKLLNTIYCTLDDEKGEPTAFLEPVLLDINQKPIVLDSPILFIATEENEVIIAIQMDESEKSEKTIDYLKNEMAKSSLSFIEPFKRKDKPGCRAITLTNELNIQYIKVSMYSDSENTYQSTRMGEENSICTLLDLVYIFSFSTIKDFAAFIEYERGKNYKVFTFGGLSNEFFTWLDMDREIVPGATEPNFLNIDFNESSKYVYDYFDKHMRDFPLNNHEYFSDTIEWKYKCDELGYTGIINKKKAFIGGFIKAIPNDVYIFIMYSYHLNKCTNHLQRFNVAQSAFIELCQRLFDRYKEKICEFKMLYGKVLHLLFVPESVFFASDYAHTYQGPFFTSSVSYGETTISIRYTINIDFFFSSLCNAKDRAFENQMLLDILKPFQINDPAQYDELSTALFLDQDKQKTVNVGEAKINYILSPMTTGISIPSESMKQIRKKIAEECNKQGIIPGDYYGENAKNVIRIIQPGLIMDFEKLLAKYDKTELHKRALEYYSYQVHGVYLHEKRLKIKDDLDSEIKKEYEEKTIEFREENRREKVTAEFLIESNLFIKHEDNPVWIPNDAFLNLLAYSKWLCLIQETSDICHKTDADTYINIDNEYLLSIKRKVPELDDMDQANIKRKYQISDYSIKNDEKDELYMKKTMEAFKIDTGIRFDVLMSLLLFLSRYFLEEIEISEIYTNVYLIEKSKIIRGFIDAFTDKSISREDAEMALNFVILDTSKLKDYEEDKESDIIPTWERKKRDNRFNVKPVIEIGQDCLFSPIILYQLYDSWTNGLIHWILPYEINMDNTLKEIKLWKKRYEKQMVEDICGAFRKAGFDTIIKEMELSSRFPKSGYPEDLGDYDIFAVNESEQEIWIIESKVFHKVGSIYEDQMIQRSVFFQNKYDEKFQKRINYLYDNLERICKEFGLQSTKYKIVPYMVTNKMFYSRYKKIAFEIIAFSELLDLLHISGTNKEIEP